MIIDCFSDMHGYYRDLPGGDLLLLCGDYTATGRVDEWAEFFRWLKSCNYRKKVLIAGNHDNFLWKAFPKNKKEADEFAEIRDWLSIADIEFEKDDFEYLFDSGTEFEGLKIWGSPWTQVFSSMNPRCMYFTEGCDKQLETKWKLIPENTDILLTHTPPFGILDNIPHPWDKKKAATHVTGSLSLRQTVEKINPKLHIFGHIHEHGGQKVLLKNEGKDTWCVNASYIDAIYDPIHEPVRIEL